MDSLKTVLLLVVIGLVIIILVKQTSDKKECYYASFDSKFNDPYINPYSKNIGLRPTLRNEPAIRLEQTRNDGTSYSTDASLSVHLSMDDPMNNDPTKLFTHLEDQDMGLYEYSNTYDTDPVHMQQITAATDIDMAYIPDKLSELRGVRERMTESDIVNLARINAPIDDRPDLMLNRFANQQNDSNSVVKIDNMSNNINAIKTNNSNYLADDDCTMKNIESFCNESPYSDAITNFPHMNMSDQDYIQTLKTKNEYETFIKDENQCPIFNKSCISSLPYENMRDVVNRYNTIARDTISGSYVNIKNDLMYDKLN